MLGVRLAAACAGFLVVVASAGAATYPKGIDVSNYQHTIDWQKVANAGYVFAFAKATEGTTFVDKFYAANREGTEGFGLRFGAYHFARPAGTSTATIESSAIAQADFLLDNAQPQAGELPPVLDLEVTGNLSKANLQAWARAWLDEIYVRTGVNALVYASPAFWTKYLGNTPADAAAGNKLWIAHWTPNSGPSLPASNWGGLSWLFWQWSDCQRIPGITGCVDGDRFNGADPSLAVIPPFPVGAPQSNVPPTVVGEAAVGKVLAAVPGSWSGGKPISLGYQWQRCDAAGGGCAAIPGATTEKYMPTSDDVGHALVVAVTAQSTGGTAAASSPPTVAISATATGSASAPAATSPPSVTGTTTVGQVLTSSAGTWTGSPTSFAYEWRRCDPTGAACGAIAGAIGSTYTLSPGDIGATVSLVVTATGPGGSSAATTTPTAVVAAAPVPAPVQSSLVAQPGQAGAVSVADGRATVTFQPGAVPDNSTVSLAAADKPPALNGTGIALGVSGASTLPWPVDIAYAAAPVGTVVGASTDGKVWTAATQLPSLALPPNDQVGTFFDGTQLHVLTRIPERFALFQAGKFGDPSLVSPGPPTVARVGSVSVKHLSDGSDVVSVRVSVPSQSHVFVGLSGAPVRQQFLLLKPGSISVRVRVRPRHRAVAHLRVAAIDPWGRRAATLFAFRG